MSLSTRARDLEDHCLTPREAVTLWIRDAHGFGSLLTYGAWLLEQPDEAYPLIRLSEQVVGAVRAKSKRVPDQKLRPELHRVEKSVLFLYQLHKQLNLRAIAAEEVHALKVTLLREKLRNLAGEVYGVDMARLERFSLPEDLTRPGRKRRKTKDELSLEKRIADWSREERIFWGEVMSLLEAARLVSERYLGGEELFYPDAARKLEATLTALSGLRGLYEEMLAGRPPESDRDFALWLAEGEKPKRPMAPVAEPPEAEARPDVTASARALAKHVVLIARAEALDDLGEREAGIQLMQEWMRSEEGRATWAVAHSGAARKEETSPK